MHCKLFYLFLFSLSACGQGSDAPVENVVPADTIFVGQNIITMERDLTPVSGLTVRGDEIIAVGDADLVLRYRGNATRVVELGDNALLPGFVDAHGHFSATARLSDFVNLSSPPVGTAENIDDIVRLLQQRIAADQTPAGDWVIGYGYDHSLLAEQRHPTRDDLGVVSTEHPVLLMHVSGHLAATNSLGLRQSEIDAESSNPAGGVIRRREGSREPNGVFEESAEPYVVDIGTYTYVTALMEEAYVYFVSETHYDGGIRQIMDIMVSFFSAHTFFWGDWHRLSFGDKCARNISPTQWAIDNSLDFTLHNDAPIVPPDMMRLLWASVIRTTRSGHILGPDQRLTVNDALPAMTLGGAYQFFEEDRKGSLRVGKQADFVILEENPLLVDPATLKDIEVVETFSRGRSVFTCTKEH